MQPDPMIFSIVFIGAMLLFTVSCIWRFRLVEVGKSEDRFHSIPTRIRHMILYAFFQKRVLNKPFGINHFVLFWSFMTLMLANAEFIVHGMFPTIGFAMLPDMIHHPLMFIFDLVSLLALICVVIAAVRRVLWPPYPEAVTPDAFIILSMVALLMIAFFNLHAIEIALGGEPAAAFMPVSSAFAQILYSGPLPYNMENSMVIWWWIHAFVLLSFLNYLPYSKHMHILTSIPNCFFRRIEKPNTLPTETFVKGGRFGVETIAQYTWKDLFDAYSCTECGRCQNSCPAAVTNKPLNPRKVIHDIKVNLLSNGPLLRKGEAPVLPLIDNEAAEGSISEDAIWSCTTCGACMEVCPVFIEQMPKLIKLRRYLVEMRAHFPEELLNLFENMEQRSNPWGIAPTERTKWCSQLPVKPFEAGMEYLFFVGCAGAFDARSKQVTLALATLLDAAGLSWGILGKEELCCGDSLRRLGNEFVFDKMVRANIELFQKKGVRKIITFCPHCYSTLKNDYAQYGFQAEVRHHTEVINQLMKQGLLKIDRPVAMGKVVYHDSCYLGRHNGIYDAPREVILGATGKPAGEMDLKRNESFCCGAGGGRMWMEEHLGNRINLERVTQALEKEPDTICVSCPYCMTMFEDGLKDKAAIHTRVKDIAEIVAEGLTVTHGHAETIF